MRRYASNAAPSSAGPAPVTPNPTPPPPSLQPPSPASPPPYVMSSPPPPTPIRQSPPPPVPTPYTQQYPLASAISPPPISPPPPYPSATPQAESPPPPASTQEGPCGSADAGSVPGMRTLQISSGGLLSYCQCRGPHLYPWQRHARHARGHNLLRGMHRGEADRELWGQHALTVCGLECPLCSSRCWGSNTAVLDNDIDENSLQCLIDWKAQGLSAPSWIALACT
jgi:hypothetical protein